MGPWLTWVDSFAPPTLRTAVEEMSFQTISGSSSVVSAADSSTRVSVAPASTVPTGHVTVLPSPEIVLPPVACVKVAPSAASTVTATSSKTRSVGFLTRTREG